MSTVSNYGELKTFVLDTLGRTELTSEIPIFISMAESFFNKTIRVREMELDADLSAIAGTAEVALPADFVEAIYLTIKDSKILDYYTKQQLETQYVAATATTPEAYTITGSNIKLAPTPAANATLELTYYQKITALSADEDTNWLLTNHPEIYIFGACIAATPYIKDDARLPVWGSLLDNSLAQLENANARSEWNAGAATFSFDVNVV